MREGECKKEGRKRSRKDNKSGNREEGGEVEDGRIRN